MRPAVTQYITTAWGGHVRRMQRADKVQLKHKNTCVDLCMRPINARQMLHSCTAALLSGTSAAALTPPEASSSLTQSADGEVGAHGVSLPSCTATPLDFRFAPVCDTTPKTHVTRVAPWPVCQRAPHLQPTAPQGRSIHPAQQRQRDSPSVLTAICRVRGGGRLMHTRSTSWCSSTSSIRLV